MQAGTENAPYGLPPNGETREDVPGGSGKDFLVPFPAGRLVDETMQGIVPMSSRPRSGPIELCENRTDNLFVMA